MERLVNQDAQNTNRAIDRALFLLKIMANNGEVLTVAEICNLLKINRATAQAIVNSLSEENFIEKDIETGKYSLGYNLYNLGSMYRHKYPFLYVAEKHLDQMFLKRHVKINLIVLKHPITAVILLSRDSSLIPKVVFNRILPAHVSAGGKLLMAYADPKLINAELSQITLQKFTTNSIIDKNKLLQEFIKIRSQGYSLEKEELVLTHACVAAPIYNISGKVIASVSFSLDKEQFEAKRETLIEDVKLLGGAISNELGYTPLNNTLNK